MIRVQKRYATKSKAAIFQDAMYLADRTVRINHVLEHLLAYDTAHRIVLERQRVDISEDIGPRLPRLPAKVHGKVSVPKQTCVLRKLFVETTIGSQIEHERSLGDRAQKANEMRVEMVSR